MIKLKKVIEVPDGIYCSDRAHLACLYQSFNMGISTCNIFQELLDETKFSDEKHGITRTFVKCDECMKACSGNKGQGNEFISV